MFSVTVELSTDITGVRVPDGNGAEIVVDLKKGLNEVPLAVAEHWYVKKFIVDRPSPPRVVVPVHARPVIVPSEPAPIADVAPEAAPAAPTTDAETTKVADPKSKTKA